MRDESKRPEEQGSGDSQPGDVQPEDDDAAKGDPEPPPGAAARRGDPEPTGGNGGSRGY